MNNTRKGAKLENPRREFLPALLKDMAAEDIRQTF